MSIIQLTRLDGSEVFVNVIYIATFARPPGGQGASRAETRIVFANETIQDVKETPLTVAERVAAARQGAGVSPSPDVKPEFFQKAPPACSVGGNPGWPASAPATIGGQPDSKTRTVGGSPHWPGKTPGSGGEDF